MFMDAAWCGLAMEDGEASSAPHDSPAFWCGPVAARRSHCHRPLPVHRQMECWRATRGVRIRRCAFAPGKASPCASGPLPPPWQPGTQPVLHVMYLSCPPAMLASAKRPAMRLRVAHLKRYLPNAGQQRVSGKACEWPGWPELRGPGRGVPQDKIWPWLEGERRPEMDKSSMPSIWGCYCSRGLSKRPPV